MDLRTRIEEMLQDTRRVAVRYGGDEYQRGYAAAAADIGDAIATVLSGTASTPSAGSVLRPWVMALPLREQGTLLTAIRGCDLTPKYPLESVERRLVAAIRFAVMVPADPREVDIEPGCFMRSAPPGDFRPSAIGHYPWHWISHVMHAVEVIGRRHPDDALRWLEIYLQFCRSFHVKPESIEDLTLRLSEDRIAAGTVVS